MAEKVDMNTFFKSEEYASSFRRAEMVTRPFAETLVEQSKVAAESRANPDQPLVVLDNACGTGVISSTLNGKLDDTVKKMWKLTCGDISSAMIEYTMHRMQEEGWQNTETKIVDAQNPELPSGQFSHIFTAFAYMTLPESLKALNETVRMLKPGGTIAFSTWIQPGWIPIARQVIESMPGNLPFPEAPKLLGVITDGQWHSKPWIESQLEGRGLQDIDVREITTKLTLTSPILVEMIMMMLPVLMKSFWTEKQREENTDNVRPAVEKYLEDTYGHGNIDTDWMAILSTARKSC
ncbi:hypothetical protein DTO006G1_8959 [Penicillium roqueforti]|uniref:uncharacterized protein n=1 Tax=Penicillium roqueforti TaxID=5082 RepID=UPI00190A04BF|nr:uncharacterized protein LCP9604111_4 [Penicillium roqueforti]KAF9252478.1 hypothetical protein LCP9604111_4 [Penicillium roqueforti]KAI2698555.1 hypothetical protein CBS147372_7085 [Penicillium roqueforti]KAI2720841.1 hypothetical protein CBS147332_4081 [Penicillium roqueforti]KAI2753431.1 hypothetical protein DTO006G1_8959 [Penicillium roqueforti]KAI3108942.1 hypothetical protein CBS147331_5734 [Penicillium roqueforti]